MSDHFDDVVNCHSASYMVDKRILVGGVEGEAEWSQNVFVV